MFKIIVLFNRNSSFRFYCGLNVQLSENVRVINSIHHNLKHSDVIQKVTGCTEQQAVESLSQYKDLQKLTGLDLLERLEVLKETGVTDIKEKNCLILAKYHHLTLKNRILSMHECGIKPENINSTYIRKFLSLTHQQISELKDSGIIDIDTNVYWKLCSHAQLLDHYTPVDDTNNIVTLKIQVLRMLLKNEIGMSDERLNLNSEILRRLKNKSIHLIRKNIEVARSLGMSSNRICRNPFLLWADPDNTLKVINEISELGGIDIKLCMSLQPKIIISPYENTLQILECLKEYNFSNVAIQRALGVFTLSYASVRDRLKDLEKLEFFSVFRHHPMALKFVYYYGTIKTRFNLLKDINVFNPTLNIIYSTDHKKFKRFYEHGLLRQPGHDVLNYICREFECDEIEFRYKVRNIHCWRHFPVVEIAKNVNILKETGFKSDEIFKCIHVIFYHRSKIIEELNSLEEKPGLECCKDESGRIKHELILPLLVYFIEKKYNFSSHTFCAHDEETHSDIVIPHYGLKEKDIKKM
ncbi:hypothetical protein O3M35_005113 [Rhynocoris fuscipes]|uniref:Transcription termination factor 5, mitochondrial n=1 Tax=Rhynocoris fuscipes TaxID=488301 RepID=A0AAW1DHW1_9HEMI